MCPHWIHFKKLCLLFISICSYSFLFAQGAYVIRYIPGNYRFDNNHRIEIFNNSNSNLSLKGFILVTRDYSFQFPSNAVIPPGKVYSVAKECNVSQPCNLTLQNHPDFLIRFYRKTAEGNYFILFDPLMKIQDAMYFAPQKNVPFLPDKGSLILQNGNIIHFEVPPASHQAWKWVQMSEDPAIGFQRVKGQWNITSANIHKNIHKSVGFKEFQARYQKQVIQLVFQTSFEENGSDWIVERNQGNDFQTIGSLKRKGNPTTGFRYSFTDVDVVKGKIYFYRIKHTDIFNHVTYSKIIEIKAEEPPYEFKLEIEPELSTDVRNLNIRFYSFYSQKVKLRLLDQQMAHVDDLFCSFIYAETPTNLKFFDQLKPGKYWVEAQTENKRYFQSFLIE
jgi:hypothetical protein